MGRSKLLNSDIFTLYKQKSKSHDYENIEHNWISMNVSSGGAGETPVTFTHTLNDGHNQRTASVIFTYGSDGVSASTITQSGYNVNYALNNAAETGINNSNYQWADFSTTIGNKTHSSCISYAVFKNNYLSNLTFKTRCLINGTETILSNTVTIVELGEELNESTYFNAFDGTTTVEITNSNASAYGASYYFVKTSWLDCGVINNANYQENIISLYNGSNKLLDTVSFKQYSRDLINRSPVSISKTYSSTTPTTASVTVSSKSGASLSVLTSDSNIAQISSSSISSGNNLTVTMKKAGTATITLSCTGQNNIIDAENKTISVNVAKATPSITINSVNVTYDGNNKSISVIPSVSGTINYGTTSGSYSYSVSCIAGTSVTLSSVYVKNVNSTATTVYVQLVPSDSNYNTITGQGTIKVNKATGYLTAITTNRTYNGSTQTIASITSNSGYYYFGLGTSTTSAPSSWGSANTSLNQTNAGTYYVWAKCDASTNYNAVAAKYIGTVTFAQRAVTVTIPTTYSPTYNGSRQTIFTSGSCTDGGVMYYYPKITSSTQPPFSKSTWSTSAPKLFSIYAGKYYLWLYCCVDDTANNKAATGTVINQVIGVSTSINKASTAAPILTTGTKSTYDETTVYAKAANASDNPVGKIYYGSSSGSTTYNITASFTAENLSSMGRTDVGTTTIYAFFRPTDTNNYNDSANTITTVTITNKRTISVTIPTGSTQRYTGQLLQVFNAGSVSPTSAATMYYYSDYTTSTKPSAPSGTPTNPWSTSLTNDGKIAESGNYYLWYYVYVPDTANNTAGDYTNTVNGVTGVINAKATPTISSKPTPNSLTYSGSAQTLCSAGSGASVSGTFKYKLSSASSWSTVRPSQTNVGSYSVDWKFTPYDTTTYNEVSETITCTISKATGQVTVIPVNNKSKYNSGNAFASNGSGTGTMMYALSTSTSTPSTFSSTMPTVGTAYNVGTILYLHYFVDETTNYTASTKSYIQVTIVKADSTVSFTPVTGTLIYNGENQTLGNISSNSNGTTYWSFSPGVSASSYLDKTTNVYAKNVGSYRVYCYLGSTTNYSGNEEYVNSELGQKSINPAVVAPVWKEEFNITSNNDTICYIRINPYFELTSTNSCYSYFDQYNEEWTNGYFDGCYYETPNYREYYFIADSAMDTSKMVYYTIDDPTITTYHVDDNQNYHEDNEFTTLANLYNVTSYNLYNNGILVSSYGG